MLAKGSVRSSNSYAAQGGVAAAVGSDDDPSLHAADTLAAGRGLCRPERRSRADARRRRRASPTSSGSASSSTTGSRSRAATRAAASSTPAAPRPDGGSRTSSRSACRAHPRIDVAEGERALALRLVDGRCAGVVTDRRTVAARATLLATGGYAALWERTTNPPGALGEGLMLAYRAGAALADLELVQFHPTALLDDGFLLSEALRGAGALLLDDDGERFTDELAPRDVVARAIAARDGAQLDLRGIERGRYPTLIATLERAGYDPAREPIPVAPAAHYSIGGIVTDLDGGSTRARPLRRRRVRVHGRPRREPARLELAARVPRLRPARRAGRAGGARARRRAADRPGAGAAGDAGAAPRALARRRPDPQRRRARRGCSTRPRRSCA